MKPDQQLALDFTAPPTAPEGTREKCRECKGRAWRNERLCRACDEAYGGKRPRGADGSGLA